MPKAVKIKCPECPSVRVWRVGVVPTRGGPRQRYKCYECAATFYAPVPKRTRKPKKASKKGK